MSRNTHDSSPELPIQPVEKPILCGPYDPPKVHWHYDRATGIASKLAGRRPARYWYKIKEAVQGQLTLELSEGQDDLQVVNALREDVARWRELGYEGVTPVTRELLQFWAREDRLRRLFFCQREAVETVVYIGEILRSGRKPRFTPQFPATDVEKLVDPPADDRLLPLVRLGCKMATGSGKTVVMAMLIAWAFCNRGRNAGDERFANGVLVCCPNLTVKERLQVLRPEHPDNYYAAFDIVPIKLRPLLQAGRVLVTNWHAFAPKSEHAEGDKSYAVVNKGAETDEAFARDRLGELFDRLPIMVLNDEAHHCYRPKPPADAEEAQAAKAAQEDIEEATVWIEGLDRINNALPNRKPGVSMCVDLSATPFYIAGSGHTEGSPFPWLVSDFGLVDAIESGIVKIPRLPVKDTTGRPDPKYFKLWKSITDILEPGDRLPGRARKPKPEAIWRESEPALRQLAGQWKERFEYIQQATPGQEQTPPVMIIVCDNTDIAEVFYRNISGESVVELTTEAEVAQVLGEDQQDDDNGNDEEPAIQRAGGTSRRSKPKQRVTYGPSAIMPELANTADRKRTIRIDTKLLAEAESEEPGKSKQDAAEQLRRVVATVGKRGEPGEHVRCVVSVSMLTEGWDANNVTHILGVRAFGSQLLCEQVVGRGLRRMDYTPDKDSGLLTEEYVDVYGIPFSVIPFKGREGGETAPIDKPKNHVIAMPEREHMEIRFPVVEGFAFALKKHLVRCDVKGMDPLELEPNLEPTATFLAPTVGYQEGHPSQAGPFGFIAQDRQEYYRSNHIQTIKFEITKIIVSQLVGQHPGATNEQRRVFSLQSRHQLFPQVYGFVDEFVRTKVKWRGCHASELGLAKYVERLVERIRTRIEPDKSAGEPPLMPILNRYKPIGTTREVDFKTVRPCHGTQASHINQVVLDTDTWEASAAFYIELLALKNLVKFYARNDHLGLSIPYEYQGIDHGYEPDFLLRLANDLTVVLEIKGASDNQTKAKHDAARRWVTAVNNWGEQGRWKFHPCYDPHKLEGELRAIIAESSQAAT